jgi:hypothetical protein
MATLKVKKVKGHEYFYWSKSVRSHKRFGGDGRVRTVDYLIGTHPISGNWLPYRLWVGDVTLEQYAEAVIKYLCPRYWEAFVSVTVSWDKPNPKVSITSIVPMFADCRARKWRQERDTLQSVLSQIIECSTWIRLIIEKAAYYLGLHNQYLAKSKEFRDAAKDARLDPDKYTPDAELHLDEYASGFESEADKLLQRYLEMVNELLVLAPPKQRTKLKEEVIRKVERLAQDRRWLDEYQAKLESA